MSRNENSQPGAFNLSCHEMNDFPSTSTAHLPNYVPTKLASSIYFEMSSRTQVPDRPFHDFRAIDEFYEAQKRRSPRFKALKSRKSRWGVAVGTLFSENCLLHGFNPCLRDSAFFFQPLKDTTTK